MTKAIIAIVVLLAAILPIELRAQTVTYLHTDALGTPIAETDLAGSVVSTSEYSPYGDVMNRPDADGPGYTGHVEDAATGLTYMQQRYYDPQVGRFLSVDPVTAYGNPVGAFNRYWYANNNPYKFTDPDGRQASGNGTPPSTGVPFIDWLMTPADARRSAGEMVHKQLVTEVSQPHSAKDVVLYTAIAMSAGTGAAGGGPGVLISTEARLENGALVVRGGSSEGANSVAGIAGGTGTHPAGVTGFSAESANGASLCQLCANVIHNQVGVTTVGEVRAAGGDVVSTAGVSPTHATVTGLKPEAANQLFAPTQPNPVPAAERMKRP